MSEAVIAGVGISAFGKFPHLTEEVLAQVAVMEFEARVVDVRVLIDMVDPPRVEQGRPPLDPMHLIALVQQKLCQIRPILPGDPGNKRASSHVLP